MKIKRILKRVFQVLALVLFFLLSAVVFFLMAGRYRLYRSGESAGQTPHALSGEEAAWPKEVTWQGTSYRYREDMLTFLLMGIDKNEEVQPSESGIDGGQADGMFLVALDPHSGRISIISIPRDTMADIDYYDENGEFMIRAPGQITLQHGYGDGAELSCERSVRAVSELFYGLPIHGYFAVNMGVIYQLNNAVGGVDITPLETIVDEAWGIDIREGVPMHMNGDEAYYYLRIRDVDVPESAVGRLERQKQYLTAFLEAAAKAADRDLWFPIRCYRNLSRWYVTDLTVDQVAYLASQIGRYRFDEAEMYTLQGERYRADYEQFYADPQALYELILQIYYEAG